MSGRDQADVTGLIGMYAHGNEPSHHAAWLYSMLGQPEKTQKYVHRILDKLYTSAPDGLCGNEDCGQMSAWYVLAAMGMYEVCPGSDVWVETEPLLKVEGFERLSLAVVLADQKCPDSLRITPVPVAGDWQMRYTGERHDVSLEVPLFPDAKIYYADLDHKYFREPYSGPVSVGNWLSAYAESEGRLRSQHVDMRYSRVQTDKHVTYLTQPAPQYTENGPEGMVDNIFGTTNYRIGGWQGWQEDMVAVVELDKAQTVRSVALDCLENMRSWVFFPRSVAVEYSADGQQWMPYGEVVNTQFAAVHARQEESVSHSFAVSGNAHAKYIKITARNYGSLPAWHVSAGQQAWLFADEIIIK